MSRPPGIVRQVSDGVDVPGPWEVRCNAPAPLRDETGGSYQKAFNRNVGTVQ